MTPFALTASALATAGGGGGGGCTNPGSNPTGWTYDMSQYQFTMTGTATVTIGGTQQTTGTLACLGPNDVIRGVRVHRFEASLPPVGHAGYRFAVYRQFACDC